MSERAVLMTQERAAKLEAEKIKLIREARASGMHGATMEDRLNWVYQKAVEARADLTDLAQFILGLNCGFPTVNEQYPNGMGAVEAAVEYIKFLRTELGKRPKTEGRGISSLRQTHTFVILELTDPAYEEIAKKLEEAGYGHAFIGDGEKCVIDMHGIAAGRVGSAE